MNEDSEYKENTFEDFFSDAIAQIPLLNSDWTNFNASDPGITILENLTAFQVLQQSYIYEISEKQKEGLLSLAGIRAHHGKAARVYLSPEPLEKNVILPSYQKFLVGDLCFENNNPIKIGNNRITDIFLKDGEKIYKKNELINREIPVSSYIWGEKPKENLEMYIVMNSLDNVSDELLVYINIDETYKRNDFTFKKENPFAKIRWQLYTENGYLDIKVKDNSECFLRDGAIRFLIPKGKATLYCHHGFSGYVIRGTLIKASYDIPPKLSLISGFLFEAWQKESKALTFTFKGEEIIDIHCNMLDLGYVQVYCQEDDAKSYHLYNECINDYDKGRYYEKICISPGIYRFIFSKKRFGYVPCNANNAIKIVVYNNETMRQYYLGQVLGYDNQTINLPFKNIISDSFSVIVKSKDDNNEDVYSFVKEGKEGEDSLYYLLDEDFGIMTITDAGKFINSQIYIASMQ